MILSICEVPEVLEVFKYVKIVINLIRIIVPIALIVSTMISFIPVVTSNNNDDLPKVLKSCVNRIIATVLVFLIPTFINAIIITVNVESASYKGCLDNATPSNISAAYTKRAQEYVSIANNSLLRSDYNLALEQVNNLKNEAEKESLSEQLSKVKQKVDKKEAEDRENAKIVGGGSYQQPLGSYKGTLTACFDGNDEVHNGSHSAVDIYAPYHTPIYASKSGKVLIASDTVTYNSSSLDNCAAGCGNYVLIDHLDNTKTKYCHMYPGSVKVKKGDTVTVGQQLGEVGSTGCSNGSHLHFQITINGEPVDPVDHIKLNVTDPDYCG